MKFIEEMIRDGNYVVEMGGHEVSKVIAALEKLPKSGFEHYPEKLIGEFKALRHMQEMIRRAENLTVGEMLAQDFMGQVKDA